jgi:hypothetical protein
MWRLGFQVLAPPLIFIVHPNELSSHRPNSALIWLGSNIMWALIWIVRNVSLAHHKWSPTWTRDNHICQFFKVPNPLSVWPVRFMYKWLLLETVPDTSQHQHLAGHTNFWTYIKITSAEPRYIHILIYLPHDTSQAQGEICATLVIARPFTRSDSLDSFHD